MRQPVQVYPIIFIYTYVCMVQVEANLLPQVELHLVTLLSFLFSDEIQTKQTNLERQLRTIHGTNKTNVQFNFGLISAFSNQTYGAMYIFHAEPLIVVQQLLLSTN